MTSKCLLCNNIYEKKNNKQKFCGNVKDKNSCSYKNKLLNNYKKKEKIILVKKCLVCDKELEPRYSNRTKYFLKYCIGCKPKKEKKLKITKEKKQREYKKHTCLLCPNEVTIYYSKDGTKNGYSKYCTKCFLERKWFIKKEKPKKEKQKKDYSHIVTEFIPQEKVKEYIFRPRLNLKMSDKVKYSIRTLKIEHCKWCGIELNGNNYNTNFCSEWCWEMQNPPDISHTCKHCGIVVESSVYKSGKNQGQRTGFYPKYCPDCQKFNPNNRY